MKYEVRNLLVADYKTKVKVSIVNYLPSFNSIILLLLILTLVECNNRKMEKQSDIFFGQRKKMVEAQIKRRGVQQKEVLDAMLSVPRHKFVLADNIDMAYEDYPLPISEGQTISQPYIVAYMTELLNPSKEKKILENAPINEELINTYIEENNLKNFGLVGHSMGGAIVAYFYNLYPKTAKKIR